MKCTHCGSLDIQIFKQVFKNGTEHALGVCEKCGKSRHISKAFLQYAIGERATKKSLKPKQALLQKARSQKEIRKKLHMERMGLQKKEKEIKALLLRMNELLFDGK